MPYEDVRIHTQASTEHPLYRLRLIEHVRTLYRKNDLTGFSPPGTVESLALPGESYKLAFTPALVKTIYVDTGKLKCERCRLRCWNRRRLRAQRERTPTGGSHRAKCFDLNADVTNPASTAAQELADARKHFFLPRKLPRPFGNEVIVTFDSDATTPSKTMICCCWKHEMRSAMS